MQKDILDAIMHTSVLAVKENANLLVVIFGNINSSTNSNDKKQ